MTISQEVIDAFKNFGWQEIVNIGNNLLDLNDRQWRFTKGLVIENAVEKYSGPYGLKYVGEDHKDFDWPKFNLSVELKSNFSSSIFGKKGNFHKNYPLKFNNSNGTNKEDNLDPNKVADILLVVKNDGAFIVDKETVIRCSKKRGDGFDVIFSKDDIIMITDKISVNSDMNNLNIKERIINAIKEVI
jgi:hypothetical protein